MCEYQILKAFGEVVERNNSHFAGRDTITAMCPMKRLSSETPVKRRHFKSESKAEKASTAAMKAISSNCARCVSRNCSVLILTKMHGCRMILLRRWLCITHVINKISSLEKKVSKQLNPSSTYSGSFP